MRDTLAPMLADDGQRTSRWSRALFAAVLATLVVVALVLPPSAVGSGIAADGSEVQPGQDSDLFPLVGELTLLDEHGERADKHTFIGVDPGLHLGALFETTPGSRRIRLVDTRTLEQLDIIGLPEGSVPSNPYEASNQSVIDTDHHRLFLPTSVVSAGSVEGELGGCDTASSTVSNACRAMRTRAPAIITVSLTGEHPPRVTRLELGGDSEEGPPEIAQKLAYHAPTEKLYVVAESIDEDPLTGERTTTLHEFDVADLLAGSGEPVWSYRVASCEKASSPFKGGFLARSLRDDFVFFACEGANLGMHGAVRIDLNVGQGPANPSQFDERFHPFAADLSDGFVRGDDRNDLLLFQGSAASAQRLFTFDAYQEAWTGATALRRGNFTHPFTNPDTKRIYVGSVSHGTLRATEGDRIAVPNGREFDLGVIGMEGGVPGFDPSSRRLFLPSAEMCLEWAEDRDPDSEADGCEKPEEDTPHFRVFEDRLPDSPAPQPEDYDQNTEDVTGHDGEIFSSSGVNVEAYGARYLWVGGINSSSAFHTAFGTSSSRDNVRETSPFGFRTRSLIRAQVDDSSLSRVTGTPTITMSATGLALGEQTESDLKANTDVGCAVPGLMNRFGAGMDCFEEPEEGAASDHADEEGWPEAAPAQINPQEVEREIIRRWDGSNWPDEYPAKMRGHEAYCDDFGGEPTEDAQPGAAVTCDSTEMIGRAGALYTAADEELPVEVGHAETSVEIRDDEAMGATATATAIARDIELFGQISIGEVRTEATVVAHGRPGTAATELTRTYRQVRIGDFTCGWHDDDQCDLWEVVRAMNDVMPPRLVAYVPAQDTTLNPDAGDEPDASVGQARVSNATPGGARAAVTLDPYDAQSNLTINQDERDELPGLQIIYYDDHNESSRHIFQFAAVNLDAYYYLSTAPAWETPDFDAGDDGFGSGSPVGGASGTRQITVPPFPLLDEPVGIADETTTSEDPGGSDAGAGEGDPGTIDQSGQASAPSLGTATSPTGVDGGGEPEPEVAQPVAQGEEGGRSGGLGGLFLTRQRIGESLPLAVLWLFSALPFYLALRRRRLMTSSLRR